MGDDRVYRTPSLSWEEFEAVVAKIQSTPPWVWTLGKSKVVPTNFSTITHKGPLSDVSELFQDLSLYEFSMKCKIAKREQSIDDFRKILKVCTSIEEYLHGGRLSIHFDEKGATLPRKKKARVEIGVSQGGSIFGYAFSPSFASGAHWEYRKSIYEDIISSLSLPLKIGTVCKNPGLVSSIDGYVYQYPANGYAQMFRCHLTPDTTIDRMLEMAQETLDRYSVSKVLRYEWYLDTRNLEIMPQESQGPSGLSVSAKIRSIWNTVISRLATYNKVENTAPEPQWPSGLSVSEKIRSIWDTIIAQETPVEQFELFLKYRIMSFEHIKKMMEMPNLNATLFIQIAELPYMDPNLELMAAAGLYFYYNKKGNIYLHLDMPTVFNPREYIRMLGVDFKL